jgi:ribosomal protein S18 acetylase RimI-like enzyme
VDEGRFWEGREERVNRWHAQSVVVLPEWQGRGIGKRLMAEVLRRAERDGVMVGLESSPKGEGLYRKLGFELLGRFTNEVDALEGCDKGGVMAWYPKGWKERHSGQS